jgi:hypothetical protein
MTVQFKTDIDALIGPKGCGAIETFGYESTAVVARVKKPALTRRSQKIMFQVTNGGPPLLST